MSLFSKDEIGKGAEKSYMSGNVLGKMFIKNFNKLFILFECE